MRCARLFALLLTLGAATQARAEFPEQPIKVIVPFAAGGFVDGFARIFTDRLGAVLGKPVIVENKPGAGDRGRPAGAAVRDRAATAQAVTRRTDTH